MPEFLPQKKKNTTSALAFQDYVKMAVLVLQCKIHSNTARWLDKGYCSSMVDQKTKKARD